MKLEITKEKVLEAAAKCSTAKETLKTLFPEVFENEVEYKTGQRFRGGLSEQDYILASCGGGTVSLINLYSGCLWDTPTKVNSVDKITKDEFQTITNCGRFTKI